MLVLAPTFLEVGFLQIVFSAWFPTVGLTPSQVGILVTAEGGLAVASSAHS